MKDVTFHVLEYNEFDKLVEEKLGIITESVADNEWNNDSSYTFNNLIKSEILNDKIFMEYDLPIVEKAMRGDFAGNYRTLYAHYLLNYMVLKDMIPEGNYLIEVCW